MATKGYFAGTIQIVQHPTKGQQVLLWACDRGYLLGETLDEDGINQVMKDTSDNDMYLQWLEYFSEEGANV